MRHAVETPILPEPPAPPRDPADYGRRRPLMGVTFWVMIVFGLVCALGGGAFAWFVPRLFPPAEDSAGAAFTPQVPPPLDPGAVAVLPPAPLDATAASAEVAALQDRVTALESVQARTASAAGSVLATAALVEASRSSRPFIEELIAVERLLPPTPQTRALRRLAEAGAPSRAVLADDFEVAAARAATAARAPISGAGLFDQIAYGFASVVSIRRVNQTAGDRPDAILARAEQLIADGNLEAALGALDGLPPKAREAMAAWRSRAERRAEIDRAVAALRAAALADLTQARP